MYLVDPDVEAAWLPEGGEPVIGRLGQVPQPGGTLAGDEEVTYACDGVALQDPLSVWLAVENGPVHVDAKGLYYRDLNLRLKALVEEGASHLVLENVYGQRYIGTNLKRPVYIEIKGIPGNDLGAFMDGPQIEVYQSVQDGCGNTMNSGSIVVHGSAGDILGHSMRGGRIFVRDDVGYRVGIHMKEYESVRPMLVIGGTAQHFLGEYMAGGVLIVLGRNLRPNGRHPARFIGTGMHGGVIYLRGRFDAEFLGKEVGIAPMEESDRQLLRAAVSEYASHFDLAPEPLLDGEITKLVPLTKRPYGQVYTY